VLRGGDVKRVLVRLGFVLLVATSASVGCRSEPVPSIVGSWRHWEAVLEVEFTPDGEVTYCFFRGARYGDVKRGRYEVLSEDRVLIDVAAQPSGEFTYEIQGDVMVLWDASGTRFLFNRVKQSED
jgi:hypothetical protein